MRRIALLLALVACSPAMPPPAHADEDTMEEERPSFRHKRSRLVAALGAPGHTGTDVISNGQTATVEGKFAYSDASKDLEDEYVVVEIKLAKGWTRVGRALTDDDGRARHAIDAKHLPTTGTLPYRMTVEADGTSAEAHVWVLPAGTDIAVFDIDGTLTPGDREIIKRAAWGSNVKVRPGAAQVVGHWSRTKKVQPIYLTGRPYLFNNDTRRWLAEHGFAAGPLITPVKMRRALPTRSGVGAFKKRELGRLLGDLKLAAVVAYGNAKTDVCAFAEAGIKPALTYIFSDDLEACDGHAKPNPIRDFRQHLKSLVGP